MTEQRADTLTETIFLTQRPHVSSLPVILESSLFNMLNVPIRKDYPELLFPYASPRLSCFLDLQLHLSANSNSRQISLFKISQYSCFQPIEQAQKAIKEAVLDSTTNPYPSALAGTISILFPYLVGSVYFTQLLV